MTDQRSELEALEEIAALTDETLWHNILKVESLVDHLNEAFDAERFAREHEELVRLYEELNRREDDAPQDYGDEGSPPYFELPSYGS